MGFPALLESNDKAIAIWRNITNHTQMAVTVVSSPTLELATVSVGFQDLTRFMGLVVGTIRKGVLETAFKNSVKAIEARNGAGREMGAA